jgi:hypothetical protein
MPNSLTFRDHEEFHRAAIHMAIAGGIAGLAAHVASLAAPDFGPTTGAWGLAAVAGGAAFGAAKPEERLQLRSLLLCILLAAASGLGQVLMGATDSRFTHGFLFAIPVAILLARGLSGRPFLVGLVGGWAATLVARFVAIRLTGADELAALPPWLVVAAAGAAFGFTLVLALLPRHLDVVVDRVAEARTAHRPRLTGEVAELADRAQAVWEKVEASLESADPVRRAIEDSVVRLYEVAGRWQAVESDGARTSADALVERMQQIDAKLEATDDLVAKEQYEQARAALAEQLRYLKEIGTSRERVVARMHHYLAAMERLRFAVINHRGHDASRLSTDVQPILDDLRDLGRDIDFTSDALGEVESDAAAARPRPTAQA